MHYKTLIVPLFAFILQDAIRADNNVTVSLINDSNYTFAFNHSAVGFPPNRISIDSKYLKPNQTLTIIGTTVPGSDFAGELFFDPDAHFLLLVRREIHLGTPIFAFISNLTSSFVISRTLNPVSDGRLLNYIAAKVLIKS